MFELLDQKYIKKNVPLSDRPFRAIVEAKELGLIEVNVEFSIVDPFDPVTTTLMNAATGWWQSTYGPAFGKARTIEPKTVIILRGQPVLAQIPQTLNEVEEEGQTAWMIIPDGVSASENPLNWLIEPPNLSKLKEEERSKCRDQLALSGSQLRRVVQNFNTREPCVVDDGLLQGMDERLDKIATLLAQNTKASRDSAMWEIQMALECCFKGASIYQIGSYRKSHDLFLLFDDLETLPPNLKRDDLKALPRWKELVSGRYGLEKEITLKEALRAYVQTLKLLLELSEQFPRKINFRGARFLLRKLPWAR